MGLLLEKNCEMERLIKKTGLFDGIWEEPQEDENILDLSPDFDTG